MERFILFVVVAFCGTTTVLGMPKAEDDEGYFWHVSDMHWDPTYSEDEAGEACNDVTEDGTYGPYGDYLCDSPWALVNSSVYAMRELHPNPDFLIWTGDDTPHIYDDDFLHLEMVKGIIFNLTDLLMEVFPSHRVYSALGNHDWHPKHQLPPRPDPLYDDIADKWQPWLDSQANDSFRQGGYYIMPGDHAEVDVVVLNTNLYYTNNEQTVDMPDPANQLQWFDDVMTQKAAENRQVIVIAHVPPGQFEKHMDYHWYYDYYNWQFVKLLQKHAANIGSVHMAHHHTDSFRIVWNNENKDEAVGSILLGPAVTPWETTLSDVMGGKGNNPSIRLLKYERSTGHILDVWQYYLNLPYANDHVNDSWTLLYRATEYYNLNDFSTQSLADLSDQLLEDDDLFSRYYLANGVAYDPDEEWDDDARAVHYCAITQLEYGNYAECMDELLGTGEEGGEPETCTGATIMPPIASIILLFLVTQRV